MTEDKRPDPKPRKNIKLWQAYLMWDELVEMRKRHLLRISSIESGKSNMDLDLEHRFLELMRLDDRVDDAKSYMIEYGEEVGEIWEWVTAIKGLGSGSLAARLLAHIDDIGKFATVSKLWRFAGLAVIDGKAEKNKKGEKSHYNRKLSSICYLIQDSFIRQQTPEYVEIYYTEKERLRIIHPEKYKNKNGKWMYNDGHIHQMARRKMIKIFLQHLWVTWREFEGLPVSEPYVQAIMGHTNIIKPQQ